MAKNARFEVIETTLSGRRMCVFKHTPAWLGAMFEQARSFGSREFIIDGGRRLTYDDFFALSDQLAARLSRMYALRPGQSVAICMKNSPEWMIAFAAIIQIGAVAILINSRGEAATMQQAIEDADCQFVFADAKRRALLESAGCTASLINVEDETGMDSNVTLAPVLSVGLESPAAMFFTSGTTGRAKPALMTHLNLVTGVMNTQLAMAAIIEKMAKGYNMSAVDLLAYMPQACALLVFPLFHTSGCCAVFLTNLMMGGKVVLMPRWDARSALTLMMDERITSFGGVPSMLWDVLQVEDIDHYDLSALRSISCGGQALPLNLLERLRVQFPNVYFGAGYGMTETSGAIAQANGDALLARPQASGQILPMVDVKIVDPHAQELPRGQTGEIWVRGPTLMQGYYGCEQEAQAAICEGWFKTGDMAYLDEADYIYIVDRKTDMIISSGENIYCAEIEQAFSRHPAITQAVAFGVPDLRLGEKLIICLVTSDESVSKTDMDQFARDHLSRYKRPHDIVLYPMALPLNAMGKVDKHQVRAAYLAQIET